MGSFRRLLRRWRPVLHVAIDEGDGPPVVLVHGIASSNVTFENLVPLLRDRHRVIALDILGFGASTAPPDAGFTVEEHVDAIAATIRRLRLRQPVVLVGHSMGALLSARYAATHPKRVAHLVLVSPPVYLPPESFGRNVDRAAMGVYLKVYEFLRENKEFTMRGAAELARFSPIRNVLEVTEQNWAAFVKSLENAIESQTTVSDVASVEAPVSLVYGRLDPFLVPGGLRILEQMRHVTVDRVEVNDHLVRKRLARAVADAIDAPSESNERST